MDSPLQVIFVNLDHSQAVEELIREKSRRLERYYKHIIDARVIIGLDDRRHHKGNLYRVTIEVNVPGQRLVVSKSPGTRTRHEDLLPTINDAFRAMIRQLEDYSHRQRGDVKQHAPPLEGRIVRLFPYEGYGYIALTDGQEVYFHRNSVVGHEFDSLGKGTPVRVVLAYGESPEGPQATTVEALGEMEFVDRASKDRPLERRTL